MSTRKRRAPGASPNVRQQSDAQNNVYNRDNSALPADSYINSWTDPSGAADLNAAFTDPSMFDTSAYAGNISGATGQSNHNRVVSLDGLNGNATSTPANPSAYAGQLVRRNQNQQLTARRPVWDPFASDGNANQQVGWDNTDDDEELEQKALLARKDAQAKRKQIPPFVQKLSSFLDEKNNTNLIRWSDDGNSFIVLDEDEFARTLIPELFKHNNYASFVRQLNMYGFHKKVGLSDNSMKASETKAKAPSEYYNKYFKRGRPELLWLIQKPKNPSSNPKRKRDEDNVKQGDSDDDGRRYVADSGGGQAHHGDDGGQEMAMIPRTEYNSLRKEVQALQQQQKIISNVLNRIRQQNDSLYQQTSQFQQLHDRHENSINAILTFLATFYNRSLEGNNTVPNISELFGSSISQSVQSHGNVVDVDEFPEKTPNKSPQGRRRPFLLLPAPLPKEQASLADRAATVSPSIRSAASPAARPSPRPSVFKPATQSSRNALQGTPTTFPQQSAAESIPMFPPNTDTVTSPERFTQIPESDEIMSAIQNMNATARRATTQGPQFDFPAALSHYQNADGNVPLTQQQRDSLLSQMANSTDAIASTTSLSQGNNALVSPQPPPMPSLHEFAATQAELDLLQKMSDEQNSRVQHLQQRLEPLSPAGTIPGLTDNNYFSGASLGDPSNYELDIDSFVNSDDFFPTTSAAGGDITLPDLSYDMTGANNANVIPLDEQLENAAKDFSGGQNFAAGGDGADGGGRIESVSSAATSPAGTVEDEADDDRSPKRRRKVNK